MELFDEMVVQRTNEYRALSINSFDTAECSPNPEFSAEDHRWFDAFDRRMQRWAVIPMFGTVPVLLVAGALAGSGVIPEEGMLVSLVGMLSFPVAGISSIVGSRRKFRGRRHVRVPKDVACAYTDFFDAEEEMRRLDTSEEVVSQVAAQQPYMEDLVAEIAELANRDALMSDEGRQMRTEVLRVGAEVWALLQMDKQRNALAAVTEDAKAVLGRAPQSLTGAALMIADESSCLEAALNGRGILTGSVPR